VLTILSSALCAEVQDSEGNIYCRGYSSPPDNTHGEIYKLSYGNWIGSLVEDTSSNFYCSDPNLPPCYDVFNGLGTDSSGGVYATEGANYHYYDPRCGQYNFVCFGNVHRVGTHQWLADFGQDVFRDLEAGDTGKLYGTVGACGSYSGAVWQLSP
jgi:hypothetical protein